MESHTFQRDITLSQERLSRASKVSDIFSQSHKVIRLSKEIHQTAQKLVNEHHNNPSNELAIANCRAVIAEMSALLSREVSNIIVLDDKLARLKAEQFQAIQVKTEEIL